MTVQINKIHKIHKTNVSCLFITNNMPIQQNNNGNDKIISITQPFLNQKGKLL
jgi:hypothetical protein